MKKFISLLLAVLITVGTMVMPSFAATTDFVDVDTDNEVLVEAVDLLDYMGVAKGMSDTEFGVDELVTREQFALFVYRLMKGGKDAPANASNTTSFTDLENPIYFYAISWANAAGIVNGRTETTFCPKDPITLKEAYAMITRALDWEKENDLVYPYGHIEIAEQEGVNLDNDLDASVGYNDELTRGDMAILLYNAFFAETGIKETETRVREIGSGDNKTWVLEEYTTNPRLCEKNFNVIEVEYQAIATPHYAMGDVEPTYDFGYEVAYFDAVYNEDGAPAQVYLSAEDLGMENLDDYFLGHFTMFVTVDDNEIDRVLFADCNMTKKTTSNVTLETVTSNKVDSYFEDYPDVKLLSGEMRVDGESVYVFDAPYSYAKPVYNNTTDEDVRYELRNAENIELIYFVKDSDNEDVWYKATVETVVNGKDAKGLAEAFPAIYNKGLFEADFIDVNGDGLYDYMNYKPYTFFQVDSDEDFYFENSKFEDEIPYIYTNEADVTGKKFADEDYVVGYFDEANEAVHIVDIVKPTVASINKQYKKDGTILLSNGDKVDAVSYDKLFGASVIWDTEIDVTGNPLFSVDVLDDDEKEFYIYNNVILNSAEVDVNVEFSENLIIPTNDMKIKEDFNVEAGDTVTYIYAWADGIAKYYPVETEDVYPAIINGGKLADEYADKLCTYSINKDGLYVIESLKDAKDEDGEEIGMTTNQTILDDEKKEDQVLVTPDITTITKSASRFDIGLENNKTVVLKNYSSIIIKVVDDKSKSGYKYLTYDATSFTRSLDDEVELSNVQAIVSNNIDSKSKENLVLLYAETDDVKFKGKADKTGYRIVTGYGITTVEDEYAYEYYVINPYTSEVETVLSAETATKASKLENDYEIGEVVKLIDGMIEADDSKTDSILFDKMYSIGEVDTKEQIFSIATSDDEAEESGNYVAYDDDTVVTVVAADSFDELWSEGEVASSTISAIAKANKDIKCYNTKDIGRNDNYVTTHTDYVRAYVSIDTDVEEDELPYAEFIIVVVYEDNTITND